MHVVMPLFTFVDISFVRQEFEPYWQGLQERCVQGLSKLLINSAENFTYTYMRKGLQNWDYESVFTALLGVAAFSCLLGLAGAATAFVSAPLDLPPNWFFTTV